MSCSSSRRAAAPGNTISRSARRTSRASAARTARRNSRSASASACSKRTATRRAATELPSVERADLVERAPELGLDEGDEIGSERETRILHEAFPAVDLEREAVRGAAGQLDARAV